jgi:hypothetical protein
MPSLALCAAILIGLAIDTQAPADISGTWTAKFNAPIGEQNYTYEFVVKGSELTGTATCEIGASPITEGKVDGDKVTFVEMLDGQIRVEYSGKIVSADEIQFSRKVGDFGVEDLVARRVKAQPSRQARDVRRAGDGA